MAKLTIEIKSKSKNYSTGTGKKAVVTNNETGQEKEFYGTSGKKLKRKIRRYYNLDPSVNIPNAGTITTRSR